MIPYSILDLATVLQGKTAADSFRNSLAFAKHAEKLGYTRYWFAEHHNMAGVASTATSVLISYVASGTKSIRVGSGGIMLPNHAPLIVAEQFGTLASLFPGRIDLGLGRAPGTDQLTAMAIRGENFRREHNFPQDIRQLQQFFSKENSSSKLRAIPGEGLDIPIWILGSSTDSARVAAAFGMPYAFASHFAPTYFTDATRLYRELFQPSEYLSEPYVMACVNVVAADSNEEADLLATSVRKMFLGVITGERGLLQPPDKAFQDAWNTTEPGAVHQMLAYSFVGDKKNIQSKIKQFINDTGVNEIMATSHIFDHEARMHSGNLFADAMNGIKKSSLITS